MATANLNKSEDFRGLKFLKILKKILGPESASIEIPPFRPHFIKFQSSFFQTKIIFFQEQKKFFQGTTFVQFFVYCKAKNIFGVIQIFFLNF